MNPDFSFFEVLILIGVAQGFVISILIWLNKKRSTSKLLLSFVLTVFNLLCIKIVLLTTGLAQTQWLRYFPLAFELAIQPLIWLYTLSLVTPDFKLSKKYVLHFVPFTLSLTYSLFIYFAAAGEKESGAKVLIANSFYFSSVKQIEDYLSIASSVIYWLLGLRLIINYRRWFYNNTSNTDYPTYAWLKNVSVLMGLLILLLTIDIALDSLIDFSFNYFFHWQIFFVYLAALIYYLGFKGYNLPDKQILTAAKEDEQKPLVELKDAPEKPNLTSYVPEQEDALLNRSDKELKLSDEKKTEIEQAILNALETKALYLDPDLNLQKLSAAINFPPTLVSWVMNISFNKNFRNLVNDYRIEKVKQRLQDPKASQYSILGIAYDCGFNSEASFYRIFKNTVGISPKEYSKQLQLPE